MNSNRVHKAGMTVACITMAFMGVQSTTSAHGSTGPHKDTPLCTTEDGSTQQVCFWDAERQGNGEGRSFYSFNYGEDIVYVK